MNILVLSELIHPHGSGAELATYLYADMLSKIGCHVAVVTNQFVGEPNSSKIGSLEIYRVPLLGEAIDTKYSILKRSDVLLTGFMRRMILWSDIVYVPRFWFSAILAAKAYGKTVVTHLHDYIPVCPLATLYRKSDSLQCDCGRFQCSAKCIFDFEKARGRGLREALASLTLNLSFGRVLPRIVGLSDAVICVSSAQRDLIVEKEPLLWKKVHVVYNPIAVQKDVDIRGRGFGYFGGRDCLKGFYLLCEALAYRQSIFSEQITVHATKLQDSGPNVKRLLKKLGFTLYGRLDETEFNTIYSQIQTVLVPSLWSEPWPYVVVEALRQQRLLIASNIGGIPEQVKGCKGAFLFEPGAKRQLSETIEMVKGFNKDQVEDFGSQSKEVFLQRFNNESSIRRFIRICEQLA